MLEAVTSKTEIAKCQRMLEDSLKTSLPHQERLSVGYPGGHLENEVYYRKGLWFSTLKSDDAQVPRYWNAFGTGKREGGHQIITVEINPPIEDLTKQVSGLFAKDKQSNTYFVLHRGRIGGGKKGIGKTAFEGWYHGTWVNVMDEDGNSEKVILVGTLRSSDLVYQIQEFVAEVSRFKNEVSSGKFSRHPMRKDKILTFDPEFYGRKSGKKRSSFEYDTYHGLVVSALEQKYKGEHVTDKHTTFNTKMIDLGIQADGRTKYIFEVKSSSDRQSIYAGIGQLMLHSLGSSAIKKTLVLPVGNNVKELTTVLRQIGIELLYYEISNGTVKFMT
jgi:hypothetical protein